VTTVPDLALAKVLRSGTSMPTRQRSSRVSRAVESRAAASEPPRGAAEAAGSQQEVATVAAATVAATTTSTVPLVSVPTAVDQAAVVEIPDDDAPPPG
jgi:hypothetical protein